MFEHRTHPIFSGVTSARSYHSQSAISLLSNRFALLGGHPYTWCGLRVSAKGLSKGTPDFESGPELLTLI